MHCGRFNTNVLAFLHFPGLRVEVVQALLQPVSKDEVFCAMSGMKSFNSLGVDGFQPFFCKKYWHVVGDVVRSLVSDAFMFGSFDTSFTETLIVLILRNINLLE